MSADTMLETFCPHCHEGCRYTEMQKGKLIECGSCRNLFHLPEAQTEDTSKRYCPSCGYLIQSNSVLCINCGFNLKTGQKVNFDVDEEAEKNKTFPIKVLHWFYDYFPGLFNPLILIAFFLCCGMSVFLVFLGLFVLSIGIFFGGIGICGSALLLYAQGIAWIMSGHFDLLKSAMVEFTGSKWDLFLLLAFAPVILLFFGMFALARVMG